jgi:hypothetical protein
VQQVAGSHIAICSRCASLARICPIMPKNARCNGRSGDSNGPGLLQCIYFL